jgi:hypothetical protein
VCPICKDAIRGMTRSPAAIEADWDCIVCGKQSFKKDADPPGSSRWAEVVAVLIFASVVVAYFLMLAVVSVSKAPQ